MEFKASNLGRPSNKKFKKITDYLLYTLPVYSTAIAGLQPVSAEVTLWIVTILNIAVISIKGLTKFTAEPEPVVVPVVDEVAPVEVKQ